MPTYLDESRSRMDIVETVGIRATNIAGHGSAASAVYFGLTLNELGVVVGIVCSVLMAGANIYFQWRKDRREERQTRGKRQ